MYLNTPTQVDDNSWLVLGYSNPNLGTATNAANDPWVVWTKPPGCSMIFILAVGGGGAGSAGASGANTTTRVGGSGGGTGAISTLLIDSSFLPDSIFISPGRGQVSDAVGGDSGDTVIALRPSYNDSDMILVARSASPTTVAGGSASTASDSRFHVYGTFNFNAGDTGTASTGTNGTTLTPAGTFLTGGGGGGNVSGAGVSINGVSIVGSGKLPSFTGGTGNSTIGGTAQAGSGGFSSIYPLLMSGGSGGGGASSGTGGQGGAAGWGCGAGGGGGGVTSGVLTRGGSGFVFIKCI